MVVIIVVGAGGGRMSDAPFLAIGADELGGAIGATITCPHCGGAHEVQHSEAIDANGNVIGRGSLSWYKCDGTAYIAGIGGRVLNNTKESE